MFVATDNLLADAAERKVFWREVCSGLVSQNFFFSFYFRHPTLFTETFTGS